MKVKDLIAKKGIYSRNSVVTNRFRSNQEQNMGRAQIIGMDSESESDNENIDVASSNGREGAYSIVRPTPNPFEVVKYSKSKRKNLQRNDGSQHYINAIIEYTRSKGEPNPYFPKLFKVTRISNPNVSGVQNDDPDMKAEHKLYHIRMERLQTMYSLSERDLKIMCINMFGEHGKTIQNSTHLANELSALIDGRRKMDIIVDFRLVEALEVIRVLLENKTLNLVLDLHSDNIMYRWTPQGPHLVITDPLA